jgi:hypothetical protein
LPYCNNCGNFTIQLDSRNHCQPCSDAYFSKEIKEKDIAGAKIKTERQLRYKMLNYIDDIELKPIVIDSNIPNVAPGQRRNPFNPNLPPTYIKSTLALVLSFLGFISYIIPVMGIFSLGFELVALSLAINSRRTEPPNWRRKIALIASSIYMILFIIEIMYLILNPDLIVELLSDLEAEGLLI